MALYDINGTDLKYIKENSFKLEKEIQTLCEKNMLQLIGYKFVKTEFTIENFRLDSLGFDETAKAFVIVEYKRDKNFSVIRLVTSWATREADMEELRKIL